MPDITDPNDPRHGTYRGHQAHRHIKDQPCDPCIRARREYNAKYDNGRPEVQCKVCGSKCRSKYAMCATCQISHRPDTTSEPVRCAECGTFTITQGDLCAYCRRYGAGTLRESDLLLDGWWVRDGLILKWVAA